jgi:hypothetical protein
MIEAVPLFDCALLPDPPQPLITNPSATIAAPAVAVSSRARSVRKVPSHRITRFNKAKAMRRAENLIRFGITSPKWETLAEVVTVNVVFAAPLTGVTVAGLNAQVIPVIGEQENVTLFAKPPAGVTVSLN